MTIKLIRIGFALAVAWSIYMYAGDLPPHQVQIPTLPQIEVGVGESVSRGLGAVTPARQSTSTSEDANVGAKFSKAASQALSEDWGVLVSRALQGGPNEDKQTAFFILGYCAQINDTREYLESVRGKSAELENAISEKVRVVEADMRRCQSLTTTQLASRASLAKDLLIAGAVGSSTRYLTVYGPKVEDDMVPLVARQLRIDVASGDFEALLSVAMFGRHFGYTAAERAAHYMAALELKSFDLNHSLDHEALWRRAFDAEHGSDVRQLAAQVVREFVAGANQRGQK